MRHREGGGGTPFLAQEIWACVGWAWLRGTRRERAVPSFLERFCRSRSETRAVRDIIGRRRSGGLTQRFVTGEHTAPPSIMMSRCGWPQITFGVPRYRYRTRGSRTGGSQQDTAR
jgi:hypothetical protein